MSIKASLNRLREALKNIYVYRSPYLTGSDFVPGSYFETMFGNIEITYGNRHGLCTINPKAIQNGIVQLNTMPSGILAQSGVRVDLSANDTVERIKNNKCLCVFRDPSMIIFPKNISDISKSFTITEGSLQEGLCLPAWTEKNLSSAWIEGNVSFSSSFIYNVVCRKETVMQSIYLQVIPLTAKTMVDIFNNLGDVNSHSITHRITIGTTNLRKLTSEQIAIAEQKGWTVS